MSGQTDKKTYVVIQDVWYQTSSDYNSAKQRRALLVTGDTTIREVMEWSGRAGQCLGLGDLMLVDADKT